VIAKSLDPAEYPIARKSAERLTPARNMSVRHRK
jgi:hypothetical protein